MVLKLVSLVQPTNLLPEKGISWCCGTRPHTHAHQPARGVPPALRVHVDSWVQEPDPRPMQTGLSPAGTRAGERTLGGKGPGSQGTGAHTTATEAATPPRSVLSVSFRARGTSSSARPTSGHLCNSAPKGRLPQVPGKALHEGLSGPTWSLPEKLTVARGKNMRADLPGHRWPPGAEARRGAGEPQVHGPGAGTGAVPRQNQGAALEQALQTSRRQDPTLAHHVGSS